MIVWIKRHCEGVGGSGYGVGGLEHLAGVEGVGVGVVVAEGFGGLAEDGGGFFSQCGLWAGREVGEAPVEVLLGLGEEGDEVIWLEV
jgi:hypothetical protein